MANNEDTAFHHSVHNQYFDSFEFVKQLYVDIVGLEHLKKIIITRRQRDGCNVFSLYFLPNLKNERISSSLWNLTQSLFNSTSLKKLLLNRNNYNKTIFSNYAYMGYISYIPLLPFMRETFSVEELYDFGVKFLKNIKFLSLDVIEMFFNNFEGNNSFLRYLYKLDIKEPPYETIFISARKNKNVKVLYCIAFKGE